MNPKLRELRTLLSEINDLRYAGNVLYWDQATYMPPGGADARASQLATLARLEQEKFTQPAIGYLLDELQSYADGLPYDSDEASLIRVTRRDYERAIRVPPEFVGELNGHTSHTYEVWAKSRLANDFAATSPYLEKTLDLSRQLANYFPGYDHIIDPLIAYQDYGMTATEISVLFNDLRGELVPLVQAITSQPPADDSCLRRVYPEAQQDTISRELATCIGYDFSRGRLDKTHHPFTINFSRGDVRITTRYREDYLAEGLYNALHEGGHALYEQGISPALEGTYLAEGTSDGVHESQSRLWENLVGRSRAFWQYWYPRFQKTFPSQLDNTSLEEFFRAINKVTPSLIRTDADEVTYNLHVMLRFDLEMALLDGRLAIKELPDAWRERYQSDLGITPQDDRDGVLQDVHWFGSVIGGVFQGYTLGNILSAQFYAAALQAHPQIPDEIAQGNYKTLLAWLIQNIYQHGAKFTTKELIERITGGPICIEPYIAYLKKKYGELYDI